MNTNCLTNTSVSRRVMSGLTSAWNKAAVSSQFKSNFEARHRGSRSWIFFSTADADGSLLRSVLPADSTACFRTDKLLPGLFALLSTTKMSDRMVNSAPKWRLMFSTRVWAIGLDNCPLCWDLPHFTVSAWVPTRRIVGALAGLPAYPRGSSGVKDRDKRRSQKETCGSSVLFTLRYSIFHRYSLIFHHEYLPLLHKRFSKVFIIWKKGKISTEIL